MFKHKSCANPLFSFIVGYCVDVLTIISDCAVPISFSMEYR